MARTATPRTFGEQLRVLRKRAGLSQRDLGIATHYSEGQICRFERGAKPPDLSTLVAMFVPALGLEDSPEAVSSLLECAAEARDESLQGRVVEGGKARAPRIGSRPAALPAHSDLVGRDDDAARLAALLNKRATRVVSLLGPPGVGKTALALAMAHQMGRHFADGAIFVALASVAHAGDVPDAIAQALGMLPAPGESARAALPALLREKQLLLVLDNIEHVMAIAPWLGELVAGAPALKLLLTSRVALRIREEQQFTLSPLALPSLSPLPALPALAGVPSVALYVQCAQAVQPAFALDEHNALAVAALCHKLDGLPLAIEMAAARTRLFSPQALLKRLAGAQRDPLRWLEQGRAGEHARHASLQRAVQWSYDLLDAADQRAFAGLGVFVDGFDDAAALRVAGCTPEQLQRLADVSLIQVDAAAGDAEPRFHLLETLRAFAGAMLAQHNTLEVHQSALLDWAMALAEDAEPQLTQGDQALWMARLHTERMNFLSALEFALHGGHALRGLRLANALWRYWLNRSIHAEGQRWLSQLLEALPAGDTTPIAQRARARAWFGLGAMKYRQGDPAGGIAAARMSEHLWQAMGDDAGLATTLNLIGVIQSDAGEFADAEATHKRVLALRRTLGDRWGEATSLNNLGMVARNQAAYGRAAQYYRDALVIRREMRDAVALALTLSNLGDVLHFQGHYAESMGHYLESLHLRREVNDPHGVAHVLTNIGVLSLYAGDVAAAERDILESLRLTREVGDRLAESNAEINLGLIAMGRGQAGAALHHFEQALALAEAIRNPTQVAQAQVNLVEALLRSGQQARAWQMGKASLHHFQAAGNIAGCADALEALALCAAATGDCASAQQWAGAVARKREEIGVPRPPNVRDSLKRGLAGCASSIYDAVDFGAALDEAA